MGHYSSDGRCHNAEPGTFNHECGKLAAWIGTDANGFRCGFCDRCKEEGTEGRRCVTWERPWFAVAVRNYPPSLLNPTACRWYVQRYRFEGDGPSGEVLLRTFATMAEADAAAAEMNEAKGGQGGHANRQAWL